MDALLPVDVQNDFLPGASRESRMATRRTIANRLIGQFSFVAASQDRPPQTTSVWQSGRSIRVLTSRLRMPVSLVNAEAACSRL